MMTLSSLVTGLAVGTALGLCGRWLVPARRGVPLWVPVAVAIGAALFGTIVGRFAGIDTAGVTLTEVVLQVVFTAAAITLVAATAERPPPPRRPQEFERGRLR